MADHEQHADGARTGAELEEFRELAAISGNTDLQAMALDAVNRVCYHHRLLVWVSKKDLLGSGFTSEEVVAHLGRLGGTEASLASETPDGKCLEIALHFVDYRRAVGAQDRLLDEAIVLRALLGSERQPTQAELQAKEQKTAALPAVPPAGS